METKMISVGLDAGMGAIKIWSEAGGLDILSQVSINGGGHLDGMIGLKANKRPVMISTADGDFYVGERAHDYGRKVENLDFDRLIGSPEMRAMVYGALTKYIKAYGVFDSPLSVMVGLPIQTMGEDMKDYRKQMRQWLMGAHAWSADGVDYSVLVQRVRVNSQPVGALFDYVMDEGGQPIMAHSAGLLKEIGIISIGFNTLELMGLKSQTLTEKFTGGEKLGVRRLLELLNPKRDYSLGELDVMLRNGELKPQEKMGIWAREVNGAIERIWQNGTEDALNRFAAVLVVGGGAVLLGNQLQLRGKGIVANDPVMSIAHGLYKLDRSK